MWPVLQGAAFDLPEELVHKFMEQEQELSSRDFKLDQPKSLPPRGGPLRQERQGGIQRRQGVATATAQAAGEGRMAAAPGQVATAGATTDTATTTGSSIPGLNAQLPYCFPHFWCSTLSPHFLCRNEPNRAFEGLIRA